MKSWYNRGQYANMVKDVMSMQVQSYKKEQDSIKKTKIAQSIGYLGQIINSLIGSQEEMGLPSGLEEVIISEEEIKEFVMYEINQNNVRDPAKIGKQEILQDITQFKKCELSYSKLFLVKMEELGLRVCGDLAWYNLEEFAKIRQF